MADSQGAVSFSDLETIPREHWPDILSNIEHYNIVPFNGSNQDDGVQEQYSFDHKSASWTPSGSPDDLLKLKSQQSPFIVNGQTYPEYE